MKKFDKLTWICGHIGVANDTLTVFLNLHIDPTIRYGIVRNRMRCSTPGILLNWAWYYPWWQRYVTNISPLQNQLCLQDQPHFAQAHFLMKEDQLLSRFDGSHTLSILIADQKLVDHYNLLAHYKLLDKILYGSWYEVQKKNFPLENKENQKFADQMFKQGMTALQYRSIAFQDWQGKLIHDCDDPIQEWHQVKYHSNFMENLNTKRLDNQNWPEQGVAEKQHAIYIDRLANPVTKQLDLKYYQDLCDLLGLTADTDLFRTFWTKWLDNQPNLYNYEPMLSWQLTTKSKGYKIAV